MMLDDLYKLSAIFSKMEDEANEVLEKEVTDYNWGYRDSLSDVLEELNSFIKITNAKQMGITGIFPEGTARYV